MGALPTAVSHITFRPTGGERVPAHPLGGGPGTLWLGEGAASGEKPLSGTLIVLQARGHEEPQLLLTDTPPDRTDVDLHACRHWIEQDFWGLKQGGWQWHRTRRRDPVCVARHLLALAVAYGTRHEEARVRGLRPEQLRRPPVDAASVCCGRARPACAVSHPLSPEVAPPFHNPVLPRPRRFAAPTRPKRNLSSCRIGRTDGQPCCRGLSIFY